MLPIEPAVIGPSNRYTYAHQFSNEIKILISPEALYRTILCFKFHVGLHSNHKGAALFVRTQYLLRVPFRPISIDTTAGPINNEMDG